MNYLTETLYGTEYRFGPPDPRWCFFRSLARVCVTQYQFERVDWPKLRIRTYIDSPGTWPNMIVSDGT